MLRKIITIDEEKCNGCGLCASACHEGAIDIIDGKAKLTRESYCDGLGDCLPACPTGAITFEEREAPAYDEAAVIAAKMAAARAETHANMPVTAGCPGSAARTFNRTAQAAPVAAAPAATEAAAPTSQLAQWPCQIKLVPVQAPYFAGANLLVAADCAAYAYANFHAEYMRNKVTVIGCPKLDAVDYSEKLAAILSQNDIKSVTVVRMEVPCCGGIENAVKNALRASGKMIPWQVVTISVDGRILD